MKQFYSRSDPRGLFPFFTGEPRPEHNRLAHFWRPLIDLGTAETTSVRLRMAQALAQEIAAGGDSWPQYSRIAVPGLRHQVLRHAGLPAYDCADPSRLAEPLRTAEWSTLLERVDGFTALGYPAKAQVIFQLAQLSYVAYAIRLAGDITPDGDPAHDRLAYDVARLHARMPGGVPRALELFGRLAEHRDPQLALSARFQGIGHALRDGDVPRATGFADGDVDPAPDDFTAHLVGSRFQRAVALLRLRTGDRSGLLRAMTRAETLHEQLCREQPESLLVLENARYLLELRIEATGDGAAELIAVDPYCVEARLTAGDAYARKQQWEDAAHWYVRAGELATGSGAVAWFRAAQCFESLGDRAAAINAMGHCLELDHTAVEPRQYLSRHVGFIPCDHDSHDRRPPVLG